MKAGWIWGAAWLSASGAAAHASEMSWWGGATAVVQVASDERLTPSATASADLVADYLLGGGTLTAWVEGATRVSPDSVAGRVPESNNDAGTAATGSGNGRVQVSELKFALPFGSRRTVTAGLIDPASYLDQNRIASDENTQFLAANFVQNPTIAFPDYTLGIVHDLAGDAGSPGFTMLMSASHGLAETAGRRYREVAKFAGNGRGVFVACAAGWAHEAGRTRLGAWVNSAEFARLDAAGATNNFGAYALHSVETGAGTFGVRAGVANPDVALAAGYLSVAWQADTPAGVLGLGAGGIFTSPQAPDPASDGVTVEAYLRTTLAEGLLLSPSVQYIHAPALDGSGAVADRNLAVANLRLSWIW